MKLVLYKIADIMYEVNYIDLELKKKLKKTFWNYHLFNKFINKCKHSKKIKILNIINNEKMYD